MAGDRGKGTEETWGRVSSCQARRLTGRVHRQPRVAHTCTPEGVPLTPVFRLAIACHKREASEKVSLDG